MNIPNQNRAPAGPSTKPFGPGVSRRTFSLGMLASASSDGYRLGKTAKIRLVAPGGRHEDATSALQAAIDAAARQQRPLILENGIYRLRAGAVTLRSGLWMIGAPGATLQVEDGAADSAILSGGHLKDVRIQGVTFLAPSDRIWALDFFACANVHVAQNAAKSCSLIRFSAGPGMSYDRVTEVDCCTNIHVVDNILDGPPLREAVGGIFLSSVLGAEVLRNRIRRHGHGIWWWGGDSGRIPGEGSIAAPRWVRDVQIEGNDIADISSKAPSSGGGIWGSKGERVRVLQNTVANCDDLEIDFEGCVDCEAVGNRVISSTSNASLAVFFYSSGIRFARNRVIRNNGGRVFAIFNSSQQFTETGSCVLEENDFESRRKIGVLGATSAFLAFAFRQNRLQNVRIERSEYSVPTQEYIANRLSFTIASPEPFDALYSKAGGSLPGHHTKNVVVDNIVTSSTAQPPDSRAIVVEDSDFNQDSAVEVKANETAGFPADICYIAAAENRIEKTAVIENNFIQHSISRQEYKASVGKTTVFLTGNRQRVGDRLQNYPNLVPTTGLWNAGQRVSFDQQEPDGAIGAICTQTGVPGQWRKLKQDLP